jgi:hypothetical protein
MATTEKLRYNIKSVKLEKMLKYAVLGIFGHLSPH